MSLKMDALPCKAGTTTVADLEKLRQSLKAQLQKSPSKFDCTSKVFTPVLLAELPKGFNDDHTNEYISFDQLRLETGTYYNGGFWYIPTSPGCLNRLKELVTAQSWIDKGDPTGDSLALVSERPKPASEVPDTPAISPDLKIAFVKRAVAWVIAITFTEEFEEFVTLPVDKQFEWIRDHITGTHENRLFGLHILIWLMGRLGKSINLQFLFGSVDSDKLSDAHKAIRSACRVNIVFTVAHFCFLAWNMVVDHEVDGAKDVSVPKNCFDFAHCRVEFIKMWKTLNEVEYLKKLRVPLSAWPVIDPARK